MPGDAPVAYSGSAGTNFPQAAGSRDVQAKTHTPPSLIRDTPTPVTWLTSGYDDTHTDTQTQLHRTKTELRPLYDGQIYH